MRFPGLLSSVSKKQYLDGDGQAGVQRYDDDEQDFGGPDVGGRQHGVEVAEEEEGGDGEANGNEDIVEDWRRWVSRLGLLGEARKEAYLRLATRISALRGSRSDSRSRRGPCIRAGWRIRCRTI